MAQVYFQTRRACLLSRVLKRVLNCEDILNFFAHHLILEGSIVRDFLFLLNSCYDFPGTMGHYNNSLIRESDNPFYDAMACLIQSANVTIL